MLPFETVAAQSLIAVRAARTLHASDAVDAATAATVDPAVRAAASAIAAGSGGLTPDAEAALLTRGGSEGAPSFALLVRPDGTIAARAGNAKLDGPLGGLPVFAEAATGIARDDKHFIDRDAWHLAAAPIYDGAILAAVVLLGWPYDGAFADRLTQQVGAPIVVLAGGQRLGSALADFSAEQLSAQGVGVGKVDVSPAPSFLPLLVPNESRYTLTTLPIFSGEDQLSVAVATDRNEAQRALAYAQALVIAGTLLVALLQLILVASTMRAVSKPIEIIVDHLSQVAQGQSVGILPEAALGSHLLRLGKQVNMILNMIPSASHSGVAHGSAPLGTPARASPSSPPILSGVGSLSDETMPPPRPLTPAVGEINLAALPRSAPTMRPGAAVPAAPTASYHAASTAASAATFAAASAPAFASAPARAPPSASPSAGAGQASGLSSLFDDNSADPLAAFRVPPANVKSAAPPPAPAREEEEDAEPEELTQSAFSAADAMPSPEPTAIYRVPQELLNRSAQPSPTVPAPAAWSPPPVAAPVTAPAPSDDGDRTVIAQVPAALVAAATGRDGTTSADDAHYKEVYTKFVETRVQCGEDTSDLTYDRFVAKLIKNRQQIMEKHKAKAVRFQVYVKDGKAALRALPVRE
jgi:hypothetical protein